MSTIWPAFEKALSEFNRKNNVDWTCRELQDNTARDIAERAFEIDEHEQDSDCCESIDIQTDTCTVCHVYHGDPCLDCGARGYHKPTCPRLSQDDNRVFASQTFGGAL